MPKHARPSARPHERGFTLAEVLVASAIFAIIFVAALLIYDRGNRVFSQGTMAADMQQSTRVAYEKVVADLRLAGFDYKRGGIPTNAVPQWLPSTPYGVGFETVPSSANGNYYRCTTAGTSNATPPAWNTGTGSTTIDGSVVWTQTGTTGTAYDQPDEQIEYAWHSAITIRANFNFDGANDATHYQHGRELNLETTQFPVVTTGNDEIVTYALQSDAPGAANSDTVTFYADVNNGGSPSRTSYPGGNAERLITITGVDLSNANPPYTLNRYTLRPDGTVLPTPLASNIRSMTFSYFQDTAATLPLTDMAATPAPITDVGGDGQFDPAHPAAQLNGRLIRGKIRAVSFQLVGMSSTSDPKFSDPTDTVAPTYRKFALQTTIVPRNLGVTGLRQTNQNPPPAPVLTSVCYGYCGIAVVTWNPGTGTINAAYEVLYSTSLSGPWTALPAGSQTHFSVDLTQLDITKHYYFQVSATNSAGTMPSATILDVDVKNATKPGVPTGITATGSVGGATKISLKWTSPANPASGNAACNPAAATALFQSVSTELKGFRVYRGTTANFNVGDAGVVRVMDENGNGPGGTPVSPTPLSDGIGDWFWDDTSVAICTQYYYKFQAVEWCAAADADNTTGDKNTGLSAVGPSSGVGGYASTAAPPAAPTNLKVDPGTAVNDNFAANTISPIKIVWDKVTADTSANAINVDTYHVYRLQRKNGIANPSGATPAQVGLLTGQTGTPTPISFTEPAALQDHDPADNGAYTYDYYVTADACGEGGHSNTLTIPAPCSTGVVVTAPTAASGAGTQASPWQQAASSSIGFLLTPPAGKTISAAQVSKDGGASTPMSSPWTYTVGSASDDATHTLDFYVTIGSCTEDVKRYYTDAPAGCTVTKVLSNVSATEVDVSLTNSDNVALTISSISITVTTPNKLTWTNEKFPVAAAYATGASASSTFTKTVSPTGTDAIIPASGGGALLIKLNFTQGNGNPPSAATTMVGTVSITYTSAHTAPATPLTCTP